MKNEYMLSLDCGTQGVRAIIFDKLGNLIDIEKIEIEPYYSEHPGWAEQDPMLYYNKLCTACKTLKEKHKDIFESCIGISITTQRDTSVLVDVNGFPLRPAIIWMDQRMAKCEEPLALIDNLKFRLVGMQKAVEITRKKSKSNWVKENQPEIWKKTYKFLLLSGFLVYKFTGKFADSEASQVGHVPFNYKNKTWPKSNMDYRWRMFGIERDKLPELIPPGMIIGYVSKQASIDTGINEGLSVIAAGTDKGCETLGVGCLDLETASLSFGTTATIQSCSKVYFEPDKFMPAYPASIPNYYNPEIEIFRGYWMISWFKKEFALREMVESEKRKVSPEEILDERLSSVPPGSQGLMLQPYWGAGLKNPDAKGAIIGFGDVHTAAYIYRAIIEGINYGLMEGMEKIEKLSKVKIKKLIVSGGGSQSDSICQITADMFNLPVYRCKTHETSGFGAAINGFVGMGVYESYSEAVKSMVHYEKIFEPDQKNVEIYENLYRRVYKKIFPKLSSLYSEIQAITNYPKM